MASGGPLAGIRVIDLTTTVLGPLTTQLLGDLGADVIKVESPDGDSMRYLGPARHPGMAAMYLSNNRNKRSLVLDLKRPAAREAFSRLVKSSDVMVHNMRTKAAARLKLAYADICAENPRIIYASATGYSADGPLADRPAFDDVIQGASGIPDLFLQSGREAQFAPFACADKVTAYVMASAVGMALFYSIYDAGGTLGPTLCGVSADLMGDPAGGVLAAAVISAAVVPIFLLHRRLGRHETMLPRP